MILFPIFIWTSLVNSIGCLKIIFGDSELSSIVLRYISSRSLLNCESNLISLLRVMKGGNVLGLIRYYEDNCPSWSYVTFLRVKSFILDRPRTAQLLLTSRCYTKLGYLVKEKYSLDASNVIKDFDAGLFGVYSNPVISSKLINKLKLTSLLGEFDPEAYISDSDTDLVRLEDLVKVNDNTPQLQAKIQELLFPYWYRAIEIKSDSIQLSEKQSVEQIIPLISEYAKKIYKEDEFAFFIIFSSYKLLKQAGSNQDLFLAAFNDIYPIARRLYSERTSTFHVLFNSTTLSSRYPYGKEHFAIRKKLSKIKFDNRSLIRYLIFLNMRSETPFESCRFFLGAENIKRMQLSREFLDYPKINRCLTSEESLLYKRKWTSKPIGGNFLCSSQDDEGCALEIADYFFEHLTLRPETIESMPAKIKFEESIRLLIDETNYKDGEIISIRGEGFSSDKQISFPYLAFYDNLYKVRVRALVKLIALVNLHFDFSWSLERETLDKIFDFLLEDYCTLDGELSGILDRLSWIFNWMPKYPEELAERAKQINWNSDV